jgi:hypothetical protein
MFATDVKNCAWLTYWQLVEPSVHSDILVVMARIFFNVSGMAKRRNCPYWSEDNPLCIVKSHVQNDPKNNITCTVNIYAAIDGETSCNGEVLQPYFDDTPLATLGRSWFHQEGRTSTFGHNHSSMVKYLNTRKSYLSPLTCEMVSQISRTLPTRLFLVEPFEFYLLF